MNNHFASAIGLGAFIIGGLLAREKTLEGLDLMEEKLKNRKSSSEDED